MIAHWLWQWHLPGMLHTPRRQEVRYLGNPPAFQSAWQHAAPGIMLGLNRKTARTAMRGGDRVRIMMVRFDRI
jgi:hypothetical protein